MKEQIKYNCPLCNMELREQVGEKMHPNNPEYGISLDCSSDACPAQEVMGHGKNSKEAYEIIIQKFKNAKTYEEKA